jgi:cytochrome c peroxidase
MNTRGLKIKKVYLIIGIILILVFMHIEPINASSINLPFSQQEIAKIRDLFWNEEPIPPSVSNRYADNKVSAYLGRNLFFDPRLSGNNSTSCATCHNPARGWSDGEATPAHFPKVKRHTPALWNLAFYNNYFWDGHADSLWVQALFPLEGRPEMDSHRLKVVTLIVQDKYLKQLYENTFGKISSVLLDRVNKGFSSTLITQNNYEGWNRVYQQLDNQQQQEISLIFANVGKSFEAFQRRILAGTSKFDLFAAQLINKEFNREPALSIDEQKGLKLFIGKANCIQCHRGINFSDSQFYNLGLQANKRFSDWDKGRMEGIRLARNSEFSRSSKYSDIKLTDKKLKIGEDNISTADTLGAFRTPSLRNVSLHPPYMHDGKAPFLVDAIKAHTKVLPVSLTQQDTAALITFLQALTDVTVEDNDVGGLKQINQRIDGDN